MKTRDPTFSRNGPYGVLVHVDDYAVVDRFFHNDHGRFPVQPFYYHYRACKPAGECDFRTEYGSDLYFSDRCRVLSVLRMFYRGYADYLITVPVILPLLQEPGFNPYAIAVCLVLLCELGNITPPVGNSVFTTAIITGESPTKIFKGVTPFFIAELIARILFGMVPTIITFFPKLMGMM